MFTVSLVYICFQVYFDIFMFDIFKHLGYVSYYSPSRIIRNAKIWNIILFLAYFIRSTYNIDLKCAAMLE